MKPAYVINRHTKESELFDPVKLHESLFSACMTVSSYEGEAHSTAERVCKSVIDWLAPKTEVTSSDIRRVAAHHLSTYQPEAAYMYQTLEMMV